MDASESQLARPVAGRDQVLSRVRERIVAFAASRISRDAAEDLAQDVLLVIERKYRAVEGIEELLPLCLRIMRLKMLAHYRKSARHGERTQIPAEEAPLTDGRPDPETQAVRKQIAERLAAAIAQIGPRCKELFRLKLEGRTFPEIRLALGVASINTIYTWDHRCRKHLLLRPHSTPRLPQSARRNQCRLLP
jgi:RNA polymerase sigma-70 factor (ECF subfamily)